MACRAHGSHSNLTHFDTPPPPPPISKIIHNFTETLTFKSIWNEYYKYKNS